MKLIFLDVDGVLNCWTSKSVCCGYTGIDRDKVKRLRKIVEATGAKLILCSTWKENWVRTDKELYQDEFANYLDRKLKRERLFITDRTFDKKMERGKGIRNYLEKCKDVENWIVLDDEMFIDYPEIIDHVLFTKEETGLTDEDVETAITMLNENRWENKNGKN